MVEPDPWQHWQRWAAMFNPAAVAPANSHAEFAAFAPFSDLSERFMAAARAYVDGAQATGRVPEAARAFGDSLRELFMQVQQPWNPTAGTAGAAAAGGVPGGMAGGMAPAWPALGATREHQQRWQRMADAWRRLEDAQRRLQRLWSDVLRDAASAFTGRLGKTNPATLDAEALRRLYYTWIDCAEEAYSRTAHGEVFCSALGDYLNAGGEWRRELQASIEQSAKLLDIPTRSEINALNLRLRALEQQLQSAPGASGAASAHKSGDDPPARRSARNRKPGIGTPGKNSGKARSRTTTRADAGGRTRRKRKS